MLHPTKYIKNLAFIFAVILGSLALTFAVLAWTEPSLSPPNGNVSAPINISSIGQIKTGNLQVNALSTSAVSGNALIIPAGNVGIGTTSPGAKLDVAGNVKIADGTQGAGKVLTSDANGVASWQAGGGGIPGSALWIQQNLKAGGGCDRSTRVWWSTPCSYTVSSNGGYVGTYSGGGGCFWGPRLLVNGAVVSTGGYRVRIPLAANSIVSVEAECSQPGCSSVEPLTCTLGLWDY